MSIVGTTRRVFTMSGGRMKVEHLSTTLINGWSLCPARAYDEYVKRLEDGDSMEGSEPTRFGSVVHVVCERMHQISMAIAAGELPDDELPEPLDLFDEIWRQHAATDFEYYQLGRARIEEFIDRTLYDRAGDTIGTEVRFLMLLDHADNDPIVERLDGLSREQVRKKVLRAIALGLVPVISTIDRIDRVEPGFYEVTDYKTNVIPFTRWEIDNSIQLRTYDLAVRALYPDAERVRCVYDMVRWGRSPVEYDEHQLTDVKAYLISTWHQIDAAPTPEAKLNQYCRYCHLRGNCATYQEAISSEVVPILTDDTDFDEAWKEVELLKNRKKAIDSRLKEVEDIFAAAWGENGGQPIKLESGGEVYFSPNTRGEYDAQAVYELLKRRGALSLMMPALRVGKTDLERAIKGRGVIEDEVKATLTYKHQKPTLRRRKVGSTEKEIENGDE